MLSLSPPGFRVETILCANCGAVIGERSGDVLLLRRGSEVTIIEGARSAIRPCRRCSRTNQLIGMASVVSAELTGSKGNN